MQNTITPVARGQSFVLGDNPRDNVIFEQQKKINSDLLEEQVVQPARKPPAVTVPKPYPHEVDVSV